MYVRVWLLDRYPISGHGPLPSLCNVGFPLASTRIRRMNEVHSADLGVNTSAIDASYEPKAASCYAQMHQNIYTKLKSKELVYRCILESTTCLTIEDLRLGGNAKDRKKAPKII